MSKKPLFKAFYKTKTNFLEVKHDDFFLAVNPVLQFSEGFEQGTSKPTFLNSRGIIARGLIAKKAGLCHYDNR